MEFFFSNPHKSHLAITIQAGNAKTKGKTFFIFPSLHSLHNQNKYYQPKPERASDHSPRIFFYDKISYL
jgi:hypothetical protein